MQRQWKPQGKIKGEILERQDPQGEGTDGMRDKEKEVIPRASSTKETRGRTMFEVLEERHH